MAVDSDADTLSLLIEGRYRQLHRIASGGLGNVYLGHDEQLQRRVAIKRLKRELEQEGPILRDAAWQEAKAMAALQHPNIVTLYDYGEDRFGAYFIMEFIDGENLDQWLQRMGPMDQDTFVEIGRQALEGVNAAHQKGILHRDIKPSNFMIHTLPNGSNQVKILDFGLAKFQQAPSPHTVSQNGHVMGSIYYIAPERFENQPIDARSDIYSLGHVFYTCLAGRPAYQGETVYEILNLHMLGQPQRLEEIRPELDPELTGWVHRLMQRHPAHRPQNTAAALDMLYNWIRARTASVQTLVLPGGSGESIRSATPQGAAGRRSSWPLIGGLAGAGVLAVAALALYLLWPSAPEKPPDGPTRVVESAGTSVPSPAPAPAPSAAVPAGSAHAMTESATAGGQVYDPRDLSALRPLLGQTVTLRGEPVALGENRAGTIIYLNFTPDYRDSVALVCFRDADPSGFTQQNLSRFLNRPVEITGVLEEYRGSLQIKVPNVSSLRTP